MGFLRPVTVFSLWEPPQRLRRSFSHVRSAVPDRWMTAKEAIGDLERLKERPEINHVWSRANRSPEQGDRILKADRPGYTIRAECHGNIQYHYSLKRRMSNA